MHSEAGAFIDELYLQARAVNTVIVMYYVCNYRIIYNCMGIFRRRDARHFRCVLSFLSLFLNLRKVTLESRGKRWAVIRVGAEGMLGIRQWRISHGSGQ